MAVAVMTVVACNFVFRLSEGFCAGSRAEGGNCGIGYVSIAFLGYLEFME